MSEDSLADDDPNEPPQPSSPSTITTANPRMSTIRSVNLDEHIKSVKQKKEEVDGQRLQRFQEQLRKKEQKWQQQQLERVRKWLQLRNRDTDHRSQVEERRRKREEEARAKIDDILRREKEREQRANSQITGNLRGNASHKSDSLMSLSTDAFLTRRAISAPRIRSKPMNMTNRRKSNDSPVTTSSEEAADQSATAISSDQHHPVDGHRLPRSRHSHDVTMANEQTSLSGTPRSGAHSRSRPMPASYAYWVNTGDNNQNPSNASFMRSTYAATCRSRLSRSVERCPRACRAHDDSSNIATTASTTATAVPTTSTAAATTNGGDHQRRGHSITRQHLDETIRRLSKPKTVHMAQSVHLGATASPSSNGIPSSHSSHQIRPPTPVLPSNNHATPTRASSTTRKIPSRPVTAPAHPVSAAADAHTNPTNELAADHQPTPSPIRQSSASRSGAHPKLPLPPSSRPPTTLPSARSKPPTARSLMTTSHSSSSLSSTLATTTPNKQNVPRVNSASPAKPKPEPESQLQLQPAPSPPEQTAQVDVTPAEQAFEDQVSPKEDESLIQESTEVKADEEKEQSLVEIQTNTPPVEPITVDAVTEASNPAPVPLSKKEQQILDEQEYQRKLTQKIREAQQRMEQERQREEERKRQLELEEYEREQEQIRLEEEQRRVEQERLQRAIEERERENELKRQEEERLQQQREELERKQAEETERLQRERQERAKKEEEERIERKRRLDLIMRRTRQASPTPKPEMNISKTNIDETNGHDQPQSAIPHSISDNRIPMSLSTDNFLTPTSDSQETSTPETPKFKSPLIQSLLNKARNTRSTDNLIQSSMTASQLLSESMIDESTIGNQSAARIDLSDEDEHHQHDSGITNTINGHSDSPVSVSADLNSYHEHSMETAATLQ